MRLVNSAILLLFFQITDISLLVAQPCNCTNCPQFMQDNFTGDFLLTVQNAANNTLGQNGQGVCGVTLNFDHEYIGDLSIVLTSPAGQSVTLVGPIGLWGPTDGTSWNITFLPCGDPVIPDPGFSANWSNNQPWGLFGSYSGSYYPFNGCLQNFNMGPVNGTWTLTVTDGQNNDVGNFYDYSIIFCDPTGILCFTCAAEAGNLTQPDISACEGSPNLNLNLPPTYSANEVPAPASEYTYTYVIAGPGGIIQAFEETPDLSGNAPGTYTVCGMSYYTLQTNQIPTPNGSLTIQQLSNQLNSSNPPFCGEITTNCVNVTIHPDVPDEEEYATVCAPGCYLFLNQNYCQSGTYTVNRLSPNGCPYTSTLYLTVLQPSFTTVNESACENGCAQTPGFAGVCDPGQYQATFTNYLGCDSIVTLNFNYLAVNAVIAPPPPFPCAGGTIQLSGVGSTAGAGTTYQWTASNGGNIVGPANGINANVNAPGNYQLLVCRSSAGVFCCDSTGVSISVNQNAPPSPTAINGPAPACEDSVSVYTVQPVPGADSYVWTVTDSVIILSGQGADTLRVTWPIPDSSLICVRAVNTCGTSPVFCLPAYAIGVPGPAILSGDTIVCPKDTVLYFAQTPGDSTVTGYVWSVDSLGVLIGGQGNDSVFVVWNQAGVGQLCYRAQNVCGAGPLRCQSVQIGGLPPAPVINGPADACQGSTVLYTTPPAGSAFSYNWQITGGTTIGGNGADSILVQWNTPADSGTLCLTLVGSCGQTPAGCRTVNLGAPPPLPVVSGDTLLCPGSIGTYSILPVAGAAGYVWIAPPGADIVAGQNTVNATISWLSPPGGNICVAALSGCGAGPQSCIPVQIPLQPVANAGVDSAFCGLSGFLNAAPSTPGSTGSWSFMSGTGMAVIANTNSVNSSVTVSQAGIYDFIWSETNIVCADTDTVQVEFYSTPQFGIPTPVCDGTNSSYTVQIQISGGTAPFIINGDTLHSNQYVSAPIPSGQTYTFSVSDAEGCSGNTLSGSYNCSCTTYAGTMSSGLLEACPNDTVSAVFNNDAALDADDVRAFVLHTGAGPALGTVIAQNTTGNFGFQAGMSFGVVYFISAVTGNDLNGAPDLNDPCLSVAAGQPVIFHDFPLVNAGTDNSTCGNMLSLNGNSGAGAWSVLSEPAGGILTINNPLNPLSSAQANIPGSYQLSWTLTQNGCSASDTVELLFFELPSVSGITAICDSAATFYTVTFQINGGAAPYFVNGQTLTAAPFVSAPVGNGQPYLFQISDTNGCPAPDVSGAFTCDCITDAGAMSGALLQACIGATVSAAADNNLILDGNDISAFVLHSGSGNSLGQVFDQNTTGIFGWTPGMTPGSTYYISRIAADNLGGNPDLADPCLSVSSGQPVIFYEVPSPNAGATVSFCGTQGQLNAVPGAFQGQWSFAGGPGTAAIAAASNASSGVTVTQPGAYRFVWTETNFICAAADTVLIRFNDIPVVTGLQEICDSVNTAYRVIAQISNGTAPFTVTGLNGSFLNNVFTGAGIPNGGTYNFTITDANGCSTAPVAGTHNCDCTTDAGTMITTLRFFCAGDSATGIWNNDATTDANDLVRFILHDQPGPAPGNILATSNMPVFAFSPGLQTGVTYYISAIAGNNVNGNVSTNDPCISVAPGTPVRWKSLPTAALSGTTAICAGSSTTLTFSGTGDYPLTVTYLDAGGMSQNILIPGAAPVTLPVSPVVSGNYQLTQVTDGTQPACSNAASDFITITVNRPLNAGQALPAPAFCADSAAVLQLRDLLNGEDTGGVWTEVSATPSTGGAFNAANGVFQAGSQQAGTYRFRYALDAAAPCPDPSAEVSVVIHPLPVADAGTDRTISCDTPDVLLGGNGSAGVSYAWWLNNEPVANGSAAQIQVNTAGVYILVARNNFGCTDSDAAAVTNLSSAPGAELNITPIQCFGSRNGRIAIDSISGGTPPLRFALNGGAFGPSPVFGNLGPGQYQVVLQDARGCEWVSDTIALAEPPLLSVDAGADQVIRLGEAATIQLTVSIPLAALDTIIWMPLLDSAAMNSTVQQFTPLNSQFIQVKVADLGGCEASDQVFVGVDRRKNIYVPNIFNPNLGGLTVYSGNDVAEIAHFAIFDRWGNALFENSGFQPNNPADGWQGDFRGEPVQPGVYAWYVLIRFIDGTSEVFTGDATIYR